VDGSLHGRITFIHHRCLSDTGCCVESSLESRRSGKEPDALKRVCGVSMPKSRKRVHRKS
jgi:hypothetical protein